MINGEKKVGREIKMLKVCISNCIYLKTICPWKSKRYVSSNFRLTLGQWILCDGWIQHENSKNPLSFSSLRTWEKKKERKLTFGDGVTIIFGWVLIFFLNRVHQYSQMNWNCFWEILMQQIKVKCIYTHSRWDFRTGCRVYWLLSCLLHVSLFLKFPDLKQQCKIAREPGYFLVFVNMTYLINPVLRRRWCVRYYIQIVLRGGKNPLLLLSFSKNVTVLTGILK